MSTPGEAVEWGGITYHVTDRGELEGTREGPTQEAWLATEGVAVRARIEAALGALCSTGFITGAECKRQTDQIDGFIKDQAEGLFRDPVAELDAYARQMTRTTLGWQEKEYCDNRDLELYTAVLNRAIFETTSGCYPNEVDEIELKYRTKGGRTAEFWEEIGVLYDRALDDFRFAEARGRELAYMTILGQWLRSADMGSQGIASVESNLDALRITARMRGIQDDEIDKICVLACRDLPKPPVHQTPKEL